MSPGVMQACIAILSVVGMFLLSRADTDVRKELRAWVAILAAQPFWLASTWINAQWGMFLVALIYTYIAVSAINMRVRRLNVWRPRG